MVTSGSVTTHVTGRNGETWQREGWSIHQYVRVYEDEALLIHAGRGWGTWKPKQEDLLAKTEQAESEDELFFEACQFVVEQGGASTSSVQRKFRIGYNRAARLIEEMQSQGIISEARGTKPRDVLISEDEFAAMQETNV